MSKLTREQKIEIYIKRKQGVTLNSSPGEIMFPIGIQDKVQIKHNIELKTPNIIPFSIYFK